MDFDILKEIRDDLKEIKGQLHAIDINNVGATYRVESLEDKIKTLEKDVRKLDSTRKSILTIWNVMHTPGLMSAIYLVYQTFFAHKT